MKKTKQLCLLAAFSLVNLSVFSQTLEEAENAEKRGDNKEAYAIYNKLANQGDAIAQFNMGFFNQRGKGTSTDYDAAESWYGRSAQQGYAKAQENLAWMYTYHRKDVARGAYWYEKAAAQQEANAIAALPSLYNANPGLKEKIKQYLDAELEHKRQEVLAKQQEKERAVQDENARLASMACLDKLYDDPRAKMLAGKMLIDANKTASLEILANTSKPNAKEKPALSYVVTEWERCIDLQEESKKRVLLPEVTQEVNAYRLNLRSSFADLYGGKITFGDLARARAKLDLEFRQKINTVISVAQEKELVETRKKQETEAQIRYAEAKNQQQREAEQQRQLEARRQLDMQEARVRLAQQQAQQQQQNNNFLQSLQMLQMLNKQPQVQPQQVFIQQPPALPAPPRQCTSTRFGSTVTTNCY